MKKTLFLLWLAATLLSCSGKNKYTLTGTFKDLKEQTVWLIADGVPIDSMQSVDGSFLFKGEITVPALAYVTDNRTVRAARTQCMFILEPGNLAMEKLAEDDNYVVRGSHANLLLTELATRTMELSNYFEQNRDKEGIDDEVEANYNDLLIKGANENTDNMFGLVCLRELAYEQDPVKTRQMLDAFTPTLRKTSLWNTLDERNQKMMVTIPGKQYIEFSQAGVDGKPISSKEVMTTPGNKYVLIDFWASWCGPCMREVPFLKETYTKYKDKGFQILGVSLDRNRDSWLKAIEDKGMNWLHVSDVKYWDNEVAKLYGVNSIPANFLVECSTGTIVATGLRGKNLEKKIAELLK